jgi:TPR repeat protein
MTNLGFLYEQGKGVPQDYKEAIRLYSAAADLGNPIAATNLGNSYFEGKLVTQDYKEAAKWYTKGAQLGDPAAQFNLARMYERGRGVDVDSKQAFKWYSDAAEAGLPAAQINLGICYAEGRGTEANPVEAHKWFNLASGNAEDENTRKNAERNRDVIAAKLTPEDMQKAQALAREWKAKPAAGDAAKPAQIKDGATEPAKRLK